MTVGTAPDAAERDMVLVGERMPFAMLPRWLLYHRHVNEGAKFLYCVLHDLVQGREGPTRPVTRAELGAVCGVSPDTVDRRLAQLVAVGAVEKQPRIRPGGQQANVYKVWFTPREGLHRQGPDSPADDRGRDSAAPVVAAANPQVNRSREIAAPPERADPGPQPCGIRGRAGAAPNQETEEGQEPVPPQPPRRAGGQEVSARRGGSPADPAPDRAAPVPLAVSPAPDREPSVPGRRSRALGTNPRAEADRAEQARLEARADARRAELERATAQRRAAERDAAVDADRLTAEGLALSAGLDDVTLADVVATVRAGLAGPLAASPMAVARAVVGWCRQAVHLYGDELADSIAAGLAAGLPVGDASTAPPLVLPCAPSGTVGLRSRIAALLRPVGAD